MSATLSQGLLRRHGALRPHADRASSAPHPDRAETRVPLGGRLAALGAGLRHFAWEAPRPTRDAASDGLCLARSARVRDRGLDEDDGRAASGSLCVLVAEDDAPVRDHAVRLLRGLGYVVRAAVNGSDALRMLVEDPRCDVLFSDVMMPVMGGGELAKAARLILPNLPIVFATGHHADPVVAWFQREGGAIVLPKPYRRQAVAAALQDAMRTVRCA